MAVLLVFLEHYILTRLPDGFTWGWVGVDIFFVLSGFLITGILFDTQRDPHYLRTFYMRRTLRIFPLYFGVLGLAAVSTPWLHWDWSAIWLLFPVYLGNFANFATIAPYGPGHWFDSSLMSRTLHIPLEMGHFWSLCVEEQFYLIWPFVILLVRDRVRLRNLCLAVVALTPLLRIAVAFVLSPEMLQRSVLYFLTPFRMDALLLGGAVALMLRGPEAEQLRRMARPVLIVAGAIFVAVWMVGSLYWHQGGAAATRTWVETVGFTLIDLMAAAILLFTLRPGNVLFRLFSIKPLGQLGRISYGFYIFHQLLIIFYQRATRVLVHRFTTHDLVFVALLGFAGTWALSYLSFRFYETPFLLLKRYFTATPGGTGRAAPAPESGELVRSAS